MAGDGHCKLKYAPDEPHRMHDTTVQPEVIPPLPIQFEAGEQWIIRDAIIEPRCIIYTYKIGCFPLRLVNYPS
jgi:hypothetical protein